MWRQKLRAISGTRLLWLGLLLLVVGRIWYFFTTGPSSLNQDEAALLLNARFLSEVGRDEWGTVWPVVFRSFGDFKLPGYIYTVLLTGKVIGFSSLTVRLPSLLAGVVLLWGVWRLATFLTSSRSVGLATALLLAVSPWSWHYGTLGYEAHFGLALWVWALHLFFSSQRRMPIVLAGVLLVFSLLTYNAPLLLLPSAVAGVCFVDWGKWRRITGKVGAMFFAGAIAGIATLSASLQKGGISLFQDPTILNAYPAYRESLSPLFQSFLGSKYVYFASLIWSNWWTHLSWKFLVMHGGGNPWHTIPETGHLHLLVPILLAFGLGVTVWRLILSLRYRQWSLFRVETTVLLLFVWSLLPAAITVDAPHATRSLFFFVMTTILAGKSLVVIQDAYCGSSLPQRLQTTLTYILAGTIVLGFALWWLPAPTRWKEAVHPRWNNGLPEALQDSRTITADHVFIVDPEGVLYTVAAETSGVSAPEFLATVRRSPPDPAGIVRVERLGKFEFIFQPSDARSPGVMLQPASNVQWDIIEL